MKNDLSKPEYSPFLSKIIRGYRIEKSSKRIFSTLEDQEIRCIINCLLCFPQVPPLLKSRKSKQVTLETAAVWGYRVEIADEHQEELRTLQGVCQLLGLLKRLTPLIQVISSHIKKKGFFKRFLQVLKLEVKILFFLFVCFW